MSGMTVPNFISTPVIVKDKDGNYYWSPEWRNVMTQLLQQLQDNFSQEGLVVPGQTAANITTLSTALSNQAILYDTDNNLFKGCIGGVFKTFTLT